MDRKREEFLYRKSVYLGRMFKKTYDSFGKDHPLTQDLLERYCKTRRELPGSGNDGAHYSTRMGAFEAYLATQEG